MDLTEGIPLTDLLAQLKLKPELVVVELNLNILKKEELTTTVLKEADQVEIVHFVGGGSLEPLEPTPRGSCRRTAPPWRARTVDRSFTQREEGSVKTARAAVGICPAPPPRWVSVRLTSGELVPDTRRGEGEADRLPSERAWIWRITPESERRRPSAVPHAGRDQRVCVPSPDGGWRRDPPPEKAAQLYAPRPGRGAKGMVQ